MVYCKKCGTQNSPTDTYCIKCGTPIEETTKKSWEKQIEDGAEDFSRRAEQWGQDFGKRAQEDCFGLAINPALIGLILGIFVIIAGILLIMGIPFLRVFGSVLIIALGLIILIGALKTSKKKLILQ